MIVGRPDTLSCVVAALVDERDVIRTPRDRAPADLALRVEAGVRARRRRPGRPAGRPARCASGRPTSPGGPAIRFDLDAVDPDDAGAALLVGFPDRLAARRRPGQFQLRNGTGAWVADDDPLADGAVRRRRRPRRQALGRPHPPRRGRRRVGHRRAARRRRRGPPAGVGRRRRRPRRARRAPARRPAPRRRAPPAVAGRRDDGGPRRPGAGDQARRPAVAAGDRAAAGAGGVPARRRSATPWPDLSDRGAAGHARRVAGAVPRRRHRPGRPRSARPRRAAARPAAVAARRRARRAGTAARGGCRRAARRRSTTPPSARRCRCGCRTSSA